MEYIVNGYQPARLFRFFEDICAIPHGSRNEAAVADYLVAFAEARGLSWYRDEIENVLISMPGSAGRENEPPVLLQGHTDMVCEKNNDVAHNFLTDPLKLAVADGKLYAEGTTLGADDGIAVAIMLTVLDGELPSHPPIECLFTSQEEIGLHGAAAFDCSRIHARRMINLDSEADDHAIVGCAGGIRSDMTVQLTRESFRGEALAVTVKGLMGGHSGENIHLGRANANKIMARLLSPLMATDDLHLCTCIGGSKDNAIPRECTALISVSSAEAAAKKILTAAEDIRGELVDDDAGFKVVAEPAEAPAVMLDAVSTRAMLLPMHVAAIGVLAMNHAVNMVAYSRNMGVVALEENAPTARITFSSRSAKESQLTQSVEELDALASLVGASFNHHSHYPGWDYAPNSPMRDRYIAVYRKLYGAEPVIQSIHAGLECGLLKNKIPDLDIISLGANLENIHSPAEKMDLASCEKLWKIIAEMLA
ncbi:MAG: beta-Ala-His dipeptidase [Clostridia bacterium]|nr:beta-Ala-His dipeptidase [Clostridia bacterium]